MAQVVTGVVKGGVVVPDAALPEGRRVELVVPEGVGADAAPEALIHDRGRGPEIRGTRITVYDILDYLLGAWHPDRIAAFLRLSSRQVNAAVEHINEHKLEVMREYVKIPERCARGNPPELQAKLDASCARFQELVATIRQLPDTDPQVRREKVAELIRQHRQAAAQGGANGQRDGGQ
jgi:uncharacterized protein (DUF433 family)